MPEDFKLTAQPVAWPLLFRYRGPVLGKGYVAVVEFHGRLLARPDGNGVWLDGVNPGALALGAPTIQAARKELNSALTGVFVDFAEETDSFEAFKAQVERFFYDTDASSVDEWQACVAEVQSGRISSPGLLPVFKASSPLLVEVTRKSADAVTPQDNPEPEPVLASVA